VQQRTRVAVGTRVASRPPVQRLDRASLRVRIVPRLVRRSHGIPARGCPFSDHEQDRILVVVVRRNTRLTHRFASAGIESTPHVAGEMFKTMAGVDLFHVPYRGAQVFPALLAGDVQVYFGPLLSSIGYVRAGKLRALAVTTATRSPMLPDVPALSETLPGYEASVWFGIGAPKRTPEEIVQRLSQRQRCRSETQGAACGSGRHGACRVARRFRQGYLRRDQEVEQGDSGGQYQPGLNSRRATAPRDFDPAYVSPIETQQNGKG
jgi:Tripartite tricarboxylate transporter family receptor